MRHGSLESGIGMFDYAAEMMGWENVFHCEINPFCRTVLNYYWPKAKSYANVFGFDGNKWRGKVDIISAGFPCQPFSNAGKRKGSTDDRFIWPENMRIFREVKPAFIVCENVPGLVTIEDGMVFEQVCLDLENEGYEVQTFIIPAVATDKDHRRDRIWIVAYNQHFWNGRWEQQQESECKGRKSVLQIDTNSNGNGLQKWGRLRHEDKPSYRVIANTENIRLSKSGDSRGWGAGFENNFINDRYTHSKRLERCRQQRHNERQVGLQDRKETWLEAATRLCSLDDGSTGRLDLKTISKNKWRTESLKAAGNTIVWEIAYEIFKTIDQSQNL